MAKSEHPFDQNIKNILESYSSDSKPDWEFMQQKMDAAESDLEFDKKIKQSLQNLQIDSDQIKWNQFEAKKNRMLERRRQIVRARLIESLLFLLLLWTLDNIGLTNILPIKEKQIDVLSPVAKDKTESIQKTSNPYASNIDNDAVLASEEIKSKDHSQITKSRETFGLIPTSESFKQAISQVRIKNNSTTAIRPNFSLQSEARNSSETELENNEMPLEHTEAIIENLQSLPVIYAGIPTSFELILLNDFPEVLNALPNKLIPVALKSTWLMAHTGLMLNTIQSPSFLDFGKTYQHQLRPGIQTALSFGVEAKKWMIESGLIYSHLSYQPNMSETLGSFENGYYKIRFDKIQSHIISIPVLLHRQLISKNNWNISAKLGLSISAALKNYFTLDTVNNLSGTVHQGIAYGTKDNSVLNTRVRNDSNQGLLDGGTFGVNSFANVVTGIRMNHQLNAKLNLYTEIELNAMLGPKKIGNTPNGFGPNSDRIIASNFNIGIAYKLK